MNILLAGLMVWTQGAGPTPVKLAPRLSVGQEYSYRGVWTEKTVSGTARYEQPFELEATMLVLDVDSRMVAEVGCYTEIRFMDKAEKSAKEAGDVVRSSNFSLLRVTPGGAATWSANDANVVPPVDGKSAWELGYLMEMPKQPVASGDKWTVKREGQPPLECKCLGTEVVRGVGCVKLICTQKSAGWDAKTDQQEWRIESTVWVNPRDSSVYRVERTHEMRRPQDKGTTRVVAVAYDQTTAMRFQGSTLQERVADFRAGVKAQGALESALENGEAIAKTKITAIKQQLKFATDELFVTPYRPALVRMRKLAEAVEANPGKFQPQATVLRSAPAEVGQKAKHFTLHCPDTNASLNPKNTAGRPLMIVMIDPKSHLSWAALDTAMSAVKENASASTRLVVVCKDSDPESIRELKERFPGDYEVCTGSGFDRSYGVHGMPHTIFIDAEGILRCNHSGYGPDLCSEVATAVKLHGQPTENIGKKEAGRGTFLR